MCGAPAGRGLAVCLVLAKRLCGTPCRGGLSAPLRHTGTSMGRRHCSSSLGGWVLRRAAGANPEPGQNENHHHPTLPWLDAAVLVGAVARRELWRQHGCAGGEAAKRVPALRQQSAHRRSKARAWQARTEEEQVCVCARACM